MTPRLITAAERAACRNKWKGAGDMVAAITHKLGIKPCKACSQRRATLNRVLPFKP
jgi:hypothetical protein